MVGGRKEKEGSRVVFIDFEASSLARNSWPIEIGVAWVKTDGVLVAASLIRPHPEWPRSAWSKLSATVHGIPQEALELAPSAVDVARRFAGLLDDAQIVSDAPEYDGRWLRRLMAALDPAPPLSVGDFDAAAHATFEGRALDAVYERLALIRAPHRAGPDAQRLAAAWDAGLRARDGKPSGGA